jgi:epoxyqueuosine reductase
MISQVERLFARLRESGWAGRIIPIGHLAELREAIQNRYEDGLIDETLYREQLSSFSFDPPPELESAGSIIIVAVPTPQMRIFFHWHSERVPLVIPPTYVRYTPRTESVQATLRAWLQPDGFHLAKPRLPLKTLAVRSGLAYYGRNNICYVPGMGSFLQLVAGFSDLRSTNDPWQEPRALDRCDSCVACMRLCPTGAITSDRFLIHAERCLTYHNEAAADFPSWIDPSWHHCLIGCLRCQTACPENKSVQAWFEDREEFSEQETALLVQGVPLDLLPTETAAKVGKLEINEDYRLLCRNLSMVILREN